MSDSPIAHALVVPAFGKSPELRLDRSKTNEAKIRAVEAKMVNPLTYTDLEHCFNEAYRELVRNSAALNFQLGEADKALQRVKADYLIDTYYPEVMKGKPKYMDSSDLRNAYLMRQPDYVAALDRINQLKSFLTMIDGDIRSFENICRYMRKQMDLIIRSGVNSNLYITQGRTNGK